MRARSWLAAEDRGFTLLLFGLGAAARVAVALALAGEPVWDGRFYHAGAARLAAGLGYGEEVLVDGAPVVRPWSHYPVGLPALLSIVYRVAGPSPRAGAVALALVGALLAVFVHRLARGWLSPVRARLAGALVALSPGLVLYGGLLTSEPLAAVLVAAGAWVALSGPLGPARVAGAGAVLGLAALVRPPSLAFAPALGLLALAAEGPLRARAGRAAWTSALGLSAALLVVAPWTARNCAVLDGCALVSTNAGWNLAIGALPRSPGHFEALRPSDGCADARGEVEQDRCWARQALAWIREDPGRWLGLAPRKLSLTFDHESFPLAYLAEARGWSEPVVRALRWGLALSFRALLVAAALSLVVTRERRAAPAVALVAALVALGFAARTYWFWPLALVAAARAVAAERPAPLPWLAGFAVALVSVTAVVFFGEDRYHLAASPFLAILAAGALRRG